MLSVETTFIRYKRLNCNLIILNIASKHVLFNLSICLWTLSKYKKKPLVSQIWIRFSLAIYIWQLNSARLRTLYSKIFVIQIVLPFYDKFWYFVIQNLDLSKNRSFKYYQMKCVKWNSAFLIQSINICSLIQRLRFYVQTQKTFWHQTN